MTDLQKAIYRNNDKAREHLESIRWPNGPICPHCGSIDNAALLKGKSTRAGVWKCRGCSKPFSVTVGTVFERSHIPLSKWLLAVHLMSASKKGMSAHQLHRMLGVTYKTAWFMAHRIREAMKPTNNPPLGGDGKTVEADETYIGNKGAKHRSGFGHKHKIVSLVERNGEARSFHVDQVNAKALSPLLAAQINAKSRLVTDEANYYVPAGKTFAEHGSVNHSRAEYGRGEIHTNTIEGFFSIFKRGMKGVYQHCSEQHLQRYLSEFDFRYSHREALGTSDKERADLALRGITGKRLTYRRIDKAA